MSLSLRVVIVLFSFLSDCGPRGGLWVRGKGVRDVRGFNVVLMHGALQRLREGDGRLYVGKGVANFLLVFVQELLGRVERWLCPPVGSGPARDQFRQVAVICDEGLVELCPALRTDKHLG